MTSAPETIFLIPGEYDGEAGLVWCEDPAPDEHCDPSEAVEYVRKDKHQEVIDRQAKAALTGMDAAKQHALSAERNAKRMLAESSPAVIESERAMNAQLTGEVQRLQVERDKLATMVKVFRGCIETRVFPEPGSPCEKIIHELVGAREE